MTVIKKLLIFGFICIALLPGEYFFYKKKTAVDVLNNPVLKMYSVIGKVEQNGIIKTDGNKEGFLAFGPYASLETDKYTVRYSIKLNNFNPEDNPKKSVGYCDVFIEGQSGPASIVGFASGDFKRQNPLDIAVTFNAPDGLPKVQFRVYQYSGSNISLVGLSFYKGGLRKFFIDRYGVLRVKTPYLLGIFFLIFAYLKLTLKNKFKKHFFYTAITSIISGIIISLIWKQMGFSVHKYTTYYDMWQVFYAPVWLTLVFIFFNFLYLINNHFGFKNETEKYIRYERYSYLVIPVFILAEIFYKNFNTQFVLGNFYLGLITVKSIIYFSFLWQNIKDKTNIETNKNLKWSLFLSVFTVYLLITPWVNACFYTDGDETVYLLQTQSLIKDFDNNITNNVNDHIAVSYHGDVSKIGWTGNFTRAFISLMMVPGFLLGGRLGATIIIIFFGALLTVYTFFIIYYITKSIKSSFIATIICGYTVPIGIYSLLLYPEIMAALLFVYAIQKLLLLRTEKRHILNSAAIVMSAILLIFIKERYIILTIMLILILIFNMIRNYKILIFIITFCVIGIALFLLYDKYYWDKAIIVRIFGNIWTLIHEYKRYIVSGSLGL
ncbi:MAG: hypothetical protein Q7K21_04355, partial [Elusimicrobiota bacterium]|nr:hypothetical protein [Elusimicrobiota bacterium]